MSKVASTGHLLAMVAYRAVSSMIAALRDLKRLAEQGDRVLVAVLCNKLKECTVGRAKRCR